MRIVDVSESYSSHGGGVRTYVHAKLAAAHRHGHEIVVLAPGTRDGEDIVPGGRIRWIRAPRSPFDARYGLFVAADPVHRAIERGDSAQSGSASSSKRAIGKMTVRWPAMASKPLLSELF